jgi:hypothetical protein
MGKKVSLFFIATRSSAHSWGGRSLADREKAIFLLYAFNDDNFLINEEKGIHKSYLR